jgi:membrane protease YdiL (CAAX protease family)
MTALLLVIIVCLTFLLTLNRKLFRLFKKSEKAFIATLENHNAYVWFTIILVAGLMGSETFNVTLPEKPLKITIDSVFWILLLLLPFWLLSGYKPGRNLKGLLTFLLVFPIGEEILFRGIIQAIATHVLEGNMIWIPVPVLKRVTLQVFISALCFGITHFQYFNFKFDLATIKKVLFAFVFGLFAGNLVETTGTILYTAVLHIIANAGTTLYYLICTKGNKTKIAQKVQD